MQSIINKNFLKNIFTEYDETLTVKHNIDPLGFQVVWTYYGQKIVKNKMTSVALDVRSYNINLFNHFVIHQILLNREGLDIDKLVTNQIPLKEKIEKILLTLENILIWSWFDNRETWSNEEKLGLLGTSRALVKWKNKTQLDLNINHKLEKLELLRNQKALGVSGRYKGPFISMGFFDSQYSPSSYNKNDLLNEKVHDLMLQNSSPFKGLYYEVMKFFKTYSHGVIVPISLIEAFESTFKNKAKVSSYTKKFWFFHLGFSSEEAAIVYENIKKDRSRREIFKRSNEERQSILFQDILEVEPQLTFLNHLFEYLLLQDGNNIDELDLKYLIPLTTFEWKQKNDKRFPSSRIENLKAIKDYHTLIEYHKVVMAGRGQSPWIDLTLKNEISVKITKGSSDVELILENGLDNEWIHDYYITSMRNIKIGLES